MRRLSFATFLAFAVAFTVYSDPQEAPAAQTAATKRPMTFEDLMQMKRLGDTAVSPDGKWLAYAVTTVDLVQNTKRAELWLQAIAGGADQPAPFKLAVGQPGDSGLQFSSDGKRILFLSSRDGGQQVWVADFDPATGATSNAKKLTAIATEADNTKWSPDSKSIVFTSAVYADCPAITMADFDSGNKCNADRDASLAASKVKAQIWTQLMYRHWDHFTGNKRTHLFLVSVDGSGMRDLNPGDPRDVPPDYASIEQGCGCDFSPDGKELAFTENFDPVPAISTHADIFVLDLTDPSSKALRPAATSILRTRRMGNIWLGGARRGTDMRVICSGWPFMIAQRRRSKVCCRSLTIGSMSLRGERAPRRSHSLALNMVKKTSIWLV
jgi:hypothetical protein